MNPARANSLVDLAYGVTIFFAIGLILVVGTNVGVAFGLGVLVSYIIHIAWKMSRFDPDWMTREVVEQVEETVSEEVEQTVEETVSEEVERTVEDSVSKEVDDVAERVEETISEEMEETVERTVSEEIDEAVESVEGEEQSDRDS